MKKKYLFFLLSLLSATPAYANSSSATSPASKTFDKKSILKKWQGTHTSDFWYGLRGGLKDRLGYLNLTDLRFDLNLDNAFPTKNVNVLVEVQHLSGNRPNLMVNSLQGFENLEEDRVSTMIYLYQLWLQKQIGDHWSILGGFYDLNSEFYVIPSGLMLILPTQGLGTDLGLSGPNAPSVYPLIGTGFRLKYTPSKKLYIQSALFDASAANFANRIYAYAPFSQGQGILGITEMARVVYDKNEKTALGKFALGLWGYSHEADSLMQPVGRLQNDGVRNRGMYGIIDLPIYINPRYKDNIIHGFIHYGVATARANIFDKALGLGVTFNGFSRKRPQDIISLGIAPAWTSAHSRSFGNTLPLYEFQAEATYVASIKSWLVLQPDVIYTSSPRGDNLVHPNSLLVGLRMIFNLDQFPKPARPASTDALHRKQVRNPMGKSFAHPRGIGLSHSSHR